MISTLESLKALLFFSTFTASFSVLFLFISFNDLNNQLDFQMANLLGEIEQFKISTDQAWTEILDFQDNLQIGTIKKRSIVERDIFLNMVHKRVAKEKRKRFDSRLPAWCQCEAIRPRCPHGPPGPRGTPGAPGIPGRSGMPGKDNYFTFPFASCPQRGAGCVRCPAGLPGFPGRMGFRGLTGEPGRPGLNGIPTARGRQGSPGPIGNLGRPGLQGFPGRMGPPGLPGIQAIGHKGVPGKKGRPGDVGVPGAGGRPGKPGLPGPMGPIGFPGRPGKRGDDGWSGPPGFSSGPGLDAGYCPCPQRRKMTLRRKQRD